MLDANEHINILSTPHTWNVNTNHTTLNHRQTDTQTNKEIEGVNEKLNKLQVFFFDGTNIFNIVIS